MNDENLFKQNLVLDQRYRLLESIRTTNQSLDEKANTLLQISGVVVGLVAAFSISDLATLLRGGGTVGIPIISQIFLISTLLFFVLSVVVFGRAFVPQSNDLPGSFDWDITFNKYLNVDATACYDQILSDVLNGIKSLNDVNAIKAKHTKYLSWLLLGQVVTITIAVVFG